MRNQREPAGVAVFPDAWRGESSYMRPNPLVMWPSTAEILTHSHLLSLSVLPYWAAQSETAAAKREAGPSCALFTSRGEDLAYQGHPVGKHMQIRWLTNTRQIRFSLKHVQKAKPFLGCKKKKMNQTQTQTSSLVESHNSRMCDIP